MFMSTSVSIIVVITPTSTIAMTTNDAFTYVHFTSDKIWQTVIL